MKHYMWLALIIGLVLPTCIKGQGSAPTRVEQVAELGNQQNEPDGVLTLPEALALAVMESPELAPFTWQLRADEAQKLQRSRRINPDLSIEVVHVLGTGTFSGWS